MPQADADAHEVNDQKVIATGQAVEVEEHSDLNGRSITWLSMKFPLRDAQGRTYGVAGIVTDITERKQAEETVRQLNAELEQRVQARTIELSATNRELEAFCYSVSHDLRTPLRSIDGFSYALLEDCGAQLDATGHEHLKRIRSNCQRMGRLIDDLLNLSRLTRLQMQQIKVDLTVLTEAAVAELSKAEPTRTVDVRIEPGLTAVGDPTLLGTVLSNLVGNAWKFTSQRPDARIEVGRGDGGQGSGFRVQERVENAQFARTHDTPVFFVRDNGVGFDMKYADKLFTPFQRLHSTTDFPGTGIGLATVQRAIHRHGGRVWIESAPGKGATCYFTI
jgi:signal transduction histidine kinase